MREGLLGTIMLALLLANMFVTSLNVLGASVEFQRLVVKMGWSFDEEWLSEFACVNGDMARLIVGVADAIPNGCEHLRELLLRNGGKIVDTICIRDKIIAMVVEVPLREASSFAAKIYASGLAEYIEPDMKVRAQLVPNDPYWSNQSWQQNPSRMGLFGERCYYGELQTET
jgi:hypothetical protein